MHNIPEWSDKLKNYQDKLDVKWINAAISAVITSYLKKNNTIVKHITLADLIMDIQPVSELDK